MDVKKNQKLLDDPSYFCAHHVGGRGGGVDFPGLPKNFESEMVSVIYDADEECTDHIEERWSNKKVIVKPYCLSNENGFTKFNVNHDPYSSSLYELNPEYGNYYHVGHDKQTDYLNSGAMRTLKSIDIETKKLDTLVEDKMVPSPDFLSISCAGAELPILKGSDNCLTNSIVAVSARVHFAEVRNKGPLFGELDQFMRKHNFMLVNIIPHYLGYNRISKNCRGAGIPLSGDTLYLYRPDRVDGKTNLKIALKLEKLALASLTYGYTEVAFEAVERSLKIDKSIRKKNSYQEFLYEFYDEVKKYKELPLLWHERWSAEKIRDRNKIGKYHASDKLKTHISMFKNKPIQYSVQIIKKVLLIAISNSKKFICKFINLFGLRIKIYSKTTNFEKFLIKNGFNKAVKHIKERKQKYLKLHIPG